MSLIRPVTINELEKLSEISETTFRETFSDQNPPEIIDAHCASAFTIDKLRGEFDTAGSAFFFHEFEGEISGFLKLNIGPAQTEDFGDDHLEIERIYLLRTFHGKGLGKSLLNYAITYAQGIGKTVVWLGVWEENTNAIGFYKALGFEPFGEHIFDVGGDPQRDLLLRLSV